MSRTDAVLTPVPGDVHAVEDEAVGTVRRSRRRGGGAISSGIVGRALRRIRRRYWGAATAESGADRWEFAVTLASVVARDAAGNTVGEFRPIRGLRGGGDLRWHDRRLTLDRPSFADHRFRLAEDDRELAVIVGGPRRMPMRVAMSFDGTLPRGAVLFAAFVVHAAVVLDDGHLGA